MLVLPSLPGGDGGGMEVGMEVTPLCDSLDLFQSPQKDFPSWLSQLTPPEQPASLHGVSDPR